MNMISKNTFARNSTLNVCLPQLSRGSVRGVLCYSAVCSSVRTLKQELLKVIQETQFAVQCEDILMFIPQDQSAPVKIIMDDRPNVKDVHFKWNTPKLVNKECCVTKVKKNTPRGKGINGNKYDGNVPQVPTLLKHVHKGKRRLGRKNCVSHDLLNASDLHTRSYILKKI